MEPGITHPFFPGAGVEKIQEGVHDDPSVDVFRCLETGLCFTSLLFDLKGCNPEEGCNTRGPELISDRSANFSAFDLESAASRTNLRYFETHRKKVENARVLEVGPGTGLFMNHCKKIAREVSGVEINNKARTTLIEKGFRVFSDLREADSDYNLIALFHVIGEIHQPVEFFRACEKKLALGGCMIIETPNADNALIRLFDCQPFQRFTFCRKHIITYTMSAMERLLAETSLEIKETKFIQRYSPANNLYWLSQGRPGGHEQWNFLDSEELSRSYENSLAVHGITDTLVFTIARQE